jgi:mRNA interferase RelE/StbE
MELKVSKRAQKEVIRISQFNSKLVFRIDQAIRKIENDPYLKGSIRLTDRSEFRYRVGKYRILYQVDRQNSCVVIVSVAHRKEAYRHH